MFPKFICVFTLCCSQGWHRDWGGKNKWESRASLITYRPSIKRFGAEWQGGFGIAPQSRSHTGLGLQDLPAMGD